MAENNTNKKIKIRIENPALGVPITFLDKYNPEQFEILNANDCRKSGSVPAKPHGLIKDKEGKITLDSASVSEQTATNKQTNNQSQSMQELSSGSYYDMVARPEIDSIKVYRRIFIRRKAENQNKNTESNNGCSNHFFG